MCWSSHEISSTSAHISLKTNNNRLIQLLTIPYTNKSACTFINLQPSKFCFHPSVHTSVTKKKKKKPRLVEEMFETAGETTPKCLILKYFQKGHAYIKIFSRLLHSECCNVKLRHPWKGICLSKGKKVIQEKYFAR